MALLELSISNLAIVDHVRLEPAPGFNVLTGETGAGKSIIVDALALLLGGRAGPGVVRAGADRAVVEGIFEAPSPGGDGDPLAELSVEPDEPLILTREVSAGGRTVCRINGRAVPSRTLTDVAQQLLDIHGQSEHLSLFRPREQAGLLDRYAGLTALRAEVAAGVRELRALRRELAALLSDERELARRVDLLTHQSEEIAAARLQAGEEEELRREHGRHANAERIAELAAQAHALLAGPEAAGGTDDAAGAIDLVAGAVRSLTALESLDPALADLRKATESVGFQLDDIVAGLRTYRGALEQDPGRLAEIDERMALIRDLERKYGGAVEEVLEFGRRAEAELAECLGAGDRARDLEAREKVLVARLGELAGRLSTKRRSAAGRLVPAVERELAELGMPGTRLAVRFESTSSAEGVPNAAAVPAAMIVGGAVPASATVGSTGAAGATGDAGGAGAGDAAGVGAGATGDAAGAGTPDPPDAPPAASVAFDEGGIDHLELWISPNPGEPLRPLRTVASGGETSRIMLAIRTVLSAADPVPVLVFDEIDSGVGGRIGSVVGRKLAAIGRRHQVLAVTHLPQIAACGDLHVRVAKRVEDGRTGTVVTTLDAQGRVDEIASMLGSAGDAARQTAADLLGEAAGAKPRPHSERSSSTPHTR
jgi:DNA repair protein RecN (Recombination protein N)